jgi:hypothetical protein
MREVAIGLPPKIPVELSMTPKATPMPSECGGCGFAHAPDYPDCVWLKDVG